MFDDFYGLASRPFQLTPDPAFFFESQTHRKALSYLGYGLAQGEGFVVITGEVGAGKSTLVAHLMATIDPARLTAAQVVTSSLDGEEIIHVIARAFGLPVAGHDKASALAAIEQFLHAEARAGRRCLLIVDEAQNLSIGALEELRMLSNFQLGAHPLLQTLLLGQPEFRGKLLDSPELEQLRQRVIATHHLEAMEPQELQPYIEHRLTRAGWRGNPVFEDVVFGALHAATGGIPRRINQVVSRLLLLGAVEQRDRIDEAMLVQVLGELDEDGTIAIVSPARSAARPEGRPEVGVNDHAQGAAAGVFEAALALRDARIQELENALVELSHALAARENERDERAQAAQEEATASVAEQIAALEARMAEQERTVRHALTMLIEWIESGEGARNAA